MQFSIIATLAALVASVSAFPGGGPGPVSLNSVFLSQVSGNYTGFSNKDGLYISALTIKDDQTFALTYGYNGLLVADLVHPVGNVSVTDAQFINYSADVTDFVANLTLQWGINQLNYDAELWPNHPNRLNLFDANGNKVQFLYRVDSDDV